MRERRHPGRPALARPFIVQSPLEKLEEKTEERHEQNESRFDRIESTLSNLAGQLKVALTVLIANGALNIYITLRH